MKRGRTFRWGTKFLGAALMFAPGLVQACPGCKQVDGAPLSGASIGYGWDIGLLLALVGSILGGLTYMIAQSCQALAERDAFLADAE